MVQNLWQVNKIKQLTSNIDRIYTQMSILLLIGRNCRVVTSYLTFVILSTVYTRNTFAKWWTSFKGGKLSYWPRYNTLTATSFASVKFQGRHFLNKIVCQKGNVIAKTIIIASLVISLSCWCGCMRVCVCACGWNNWTVNITVFSVALNSLPTSLYWQANDHSVSLFIEATSKKMSLKYLATREFSATVLMWLL